MEKKFRIIAPIGRYNYYQHNVTDALLVQFKSEDGELPWIGTGFRIGDILTLDDLDYLMDKGIHFNYITEEVVKVEDDYLNLNELLSKK